MIGVIGTTITMTRGDTFRAKITIYKANGEVYECNDDDIVTFTVKRDYESNEILLQKQINNKTLILEIEPEETKGFKMPCTLVYDIQLEKADGTIDTFIAKAQLRITEEVG